MSSLKIGIAGTRGIPAVYGGFETFAEELSTRLHERGYTITVYCDKGSYREDTLKGVRLKFMPLKKSSNQVLYFFLSLYQGLRENDILIVTSTGASYFYWINIFFKKVIITNSDGIESLRTKWSFFTRKYLYYSQYFASRWSTLVVTDSVGIEHYWRLNYPRSVHVTTIEYGAPVVDNSPQAEALIAQYHLRPNDYYLVVARLEPENNIKMMIEGFLQSESRKKLVIIGGLTSAHYQNELKNFPSERVIFLDAIYDSACLQALRLNTFAYLHGHSVGGTNPSLLEAMGCSNLCLCHDNIFNREVTKDEQFYFANEAELATRMNELEKLEPSVLDEFRSKARRRIENYYTWERITDDYIKVFKKLKRN